MDDKAQNVLDFAKHILASKTEDHDQREASQYAKLYIQSLPLARAQIPAKMRNDFKRAAMELYNQHTMLAKDEDLTSPTNAHAVLIRALALLMFSSLTKQKPGVEFAVSSLTNAVFSTTKGCLRTNQLDVAGKLVEHFALNEAMDGLVKDQQDSRCEFRKCLITFNCLRLSLAWKSDRLDLAEHWYNHIESLCLRRTESSVVEALVDLLLEIGLQELKCTNIATAVTWLRRAYMCVQADTVKEDVLTTDLRLNVLHAYCRALHRSPDFGHRQLSKQLLAELLHEHGSKLSVQLLQLECLKPGFPNSLATFVQTLKGIVASVPLVDNTHHLIIHYVQTLFETDALAAQDVFAQYINERLIPASMTNWTEEAIIKYLWLCAGCGGTAALMDGSELYLKLDDFSKASELALSHAAAQAAHTIIWKVINQLGSDSQASTVSWCKIGLHKQFEQSDETSIGKLERRLAMCYMSISDLEAAQSVLDGMTFLRKNNRLSLFLSYAVAIRTGQETQAQVALNTMANAPEDNSSLLMACAAEVKRHGSPLEVARLLQRLFDRQIQRPISGIDRAALLKSVTQVLIHVTGEDDFRNNEEVLSRLCGAFKAASSHLESGSVCWFASVAYEIGINKSTVWPSRFVLEILHYAEHLWMMSKRTKVPNISTNEQPYWRILEAQVLLYASEAQRAASSTLTINDLPKTSYEGKARPNTDEIPRLLNEQVCKKFMLLQQEFSEHENITMNRDAQSRLHDLFPVAFEALLNLNTLVFVESQDLAFDEASLQALLRSAQQLQVPAGTYALLADQILSATSTQVEQSRHHVRMPLLVGARLLGQVITALRNLEVYEIDQAARWIRCIVQLIVSRLEQQLEDGVDEVKLERSGISMLNVVIGQAIDLAQGSLSNEIHEIEDVIMTDGDSTLVAQASYPAEELEWLITKVFNLSIDLVVAQRTKLACFWSQRALEIADVMVEMRSDRGSDLREMLTERLTELGLDSSRADI